MNLAAAASAARSQGFDYLLFDLVSVRQDQQHGKLIEDIANLARLFSVLPVFVAYDRADVSHWLPTMRRPWLFCEARAFHGNGHKLTYVAHQDKQGGASSFGFAHMLESVWATNFTSTVLLLLANLTGIGELGDLAHIVPYHREILQSACEQLCRNDFLLPTAVLCQVFFDDGRFHVGGDDPDLDLLLHSYERFRLVSSDGPDDQYEYYDVLFDNAKVAKYWKRTKLDRFTSALTYVRYLTACEDAGELLHEMLCPAAAGTYRSQKSQMRASFEIPDEVEKHREHAERSVQIVNVAELASKRQGFVVFRPWAR